MGAERARTAGFGRLEAACGRRATGTSGGRTSASASGARCGRTTAPTARRGTYFPHDHARSRAYRWGEDGLAGFCDVEQRLCLGLALWNGRDPILKERIFGLTGAEGNHGEDAKEYWWYLDAAAEPRLEPVALPLPAAARSRTRTWSRRTAGAGGCDAGVRAARHRRVRRRPLLDRRGRLRQGRPDDLLMTVRVTNAGPEPTPCTCCRPLWFRNTWSWEADGAAGPQLAAAAAPCVGRPPVPRRARTGRRRRTGRRPARAVLRQRDQHRAAVRGAPAHAATRRTASTTTWSTAPPPSTRRSAGTKAAFWYRLTVAPGETGRAAAAAAPAEPARPRAALGAGFDEVARRGRPRPTSSTPN